MFALPFLRRDTPSLRGERVHLRMPDAGDFRAWADLRKESRSFLEPWEPTWAPDELDRASWRDRLARHRQEFAQGTGVAFFIYENRSEALIGGITLGNIRHGVAQSGHIGYWLGERHAGHGYMVDALQLLLEFAFDSLSLHRVEAACIPGNVRSMRVLEKARFRREGLLRSYLRINGNWQDHYLYALIAEEWRGERAKG